MNGDDDVHILGSSSSASFSRSRHLSSSSGALVVDDGEPPSSFVTTTAANPNNKMILVHPRHSPKNRPHTAALLQQFTASRWIINNGPNANSAVCDFEASDRGASVLFGVLSEWQRKYRTDGGAANQASMSFLSRLLSSARSTASPSSSSSHHVLSLVVFCDVHLRAQSQFHATTSGGTSVVGDTPRRSDSNSERQPTERMRTEASTNALMGGSAEPDLAFLTHLNFACMDHKALLFLAWSWKEAANMIEALCLHRASPTFFVERSTTGSGGSSSSNILLEALQKTHTLSRQDILRLRDKFKTPAEIFRQGAESLATLPSFGPKKAQRLERIFNSAFPSERVTLNDLLAVGSTQVAAKTPSSNVVLGEAPLSSSVSAVAVEPPAKNRSTVGQPEPAVAVHLPMAVKFAEMQANRRSSMMAPTAKLFASEVSHSNAMETALRKRLREEQQDDDDSEEKEGK